MPFNEKYLITATALLLVTITGCPDNGKEPDYNIYLTAEDIFCTEVILRVTLPDSGRINAFALDRAEGAAMENETAIDTFTCYDDDTLITDENLLPDRDYTYRVNFLKNGKIKATSEPITIHTMDTTSHNFTWEIDTLGIYGSYLNDVWIVEEDDIWVVGQIVVPDPDSSFDGTGRETFNAAHWNGEEWELIHIEEAATPLEGIFAFSKDDIWVTSGIPAHWNGYKWKLYHLWNMGILNENDGGVPHMWGKSSSDIYFVGRKGTIVHYDGENFEKMESGTESDLKDIVGVYDPSSGKIRIWVAGVGVLLYSDGKDWEVIWDKNNPFFRNNFINPTAIYIPDNNHIVVATWNGGEVQITLHRQESFSDYLVLFNLDNFYVNSISGNNIIDFFLAGTYNEVAHYNGSSVSLYRSLESFGELRSCKQNRDQFYAVGYTGAGFSRAIFIKGKR